MTMEYRKVIQLKDGRMCVLRNGTEEDGQALLDIFLLTHSQTDYLLTYPDEANMTADQEAAWLSAGWSNSRPVPPRNHGIPDGKEPDKVMYGIWMDR